MVILNINTSEKKLKFVMQTVAWFVTLYMLNNESVKLSDIAFSHF